MEMKQLVYLFLLKFRIALPSKQLKSQKSNSKTCDIIGSSTIEDKRSRDAGGGEVDNNRHWEISIPFIRTKEGLKVRLMRI
jgi:hypothetical protein